MSFCNFIVNAVGDANCIFFKSASDSLMIDCGADNKTIFQNNPTLSEQIKSTKNLLISHYHTDHFNILFSLNRNEINISQLYYPYLPKIKQKPVFIKELLFISYLQQKLSISKAFDLISLLKQINSKNFDFEPLYQGRNILNNSIEVIWPPKELLPSQKIKLNKKIMEINEDIKKIPEISKLWEQFDQFDVNTATQFLKHDWNDSSGIINKKHIDIEKYRDEIANLDAKMKAITNSLSICLYKENDFLFLGDLEKKEVEECLKQLQAKLNTKIINIKYFITPHHGTIAHYSEAVKIIRADYVISSNGERRCSAYQSEYNKLATYHHCTHENGNFERAKARCLSHYYFNDW